MKATFKRYFGESTKRAGKQRENRHMDNMNKDKISIIIPVYKVEAYLQKCLDSLVHQTYSNLEIILVDDASPDGCGKICDEYAARDGRIRVIHKPKNEGQASARNTGLDVASGEYVSFVDSDDWLSEDAFEKLYSGLLEYGADCSVGCCVVVLDRNGELTEQECPARPTKCETAQEAVKNVLLRESAAWNRLYRRSVFEKLRFQVGRINDDEALVLRAYAEMGKIVFLSAKTYYYRKRHGSITTAKFSVKMLDCVYNSRDNLAFIREKLPELVPCAEYKYIKTMLWCYVNLRKVKDDSRAPELRRQLRREIRANRSTALHNKYLSLPLKLLAALC